MSLIHQCISKGPIKIIVVCVRSMRCPSDYGHWESMQEMWCCLLLSEEYYGRRYNFNLELVFMDVGAYYGLLADLYK